jgi:hypothetical protein
VNENIAVWTEQQYKGYKVLYIEPIPRSQVFMVDMLVQGQVTVIAANGQIGAQLVTILQMNNDEMFHARWAPIDDVEGGLYQLSGMSRNKMRGGQSRVSLFTERYDPFLSTTTFWVLGENKDAQIETRNPQPVAIYTARFAFWGFRYLLSPQIAPASNATYLPAQGR